MSNEAIPLESTLIGKIKEAGQNFKKTRKNKMGRYPDQIRKMAIQALEVGVPVKNLAEILGSHPSTVYGWINLPNKKNFSKKTPHRPPLKATSKPLRLIEPTPPPTFSPSRLEISLGLFKVVLCF